MAEDDELNPKPVGKRTTGVGFFGADFRASGGAT
jgi:hypothetical protein